jgi:orotidine-5'-phosphate decarboxylase
LGSSVESYKIGLELVMAGGSAVLIDHLRRLKKRIFLDVKLHDIGTTVQRSVAAAADFGGAGRHRVHRCQKLGMTVGISRLRSDSLAFVV